MVFQKGNKFALGLDTSGRPPIYANDDEGYALLRDKCLEYFDECDIKEEKPNITGLALFLGFSSRGTLNEYAKKPVFSDIVKRAMLAVENSYENSGSTFDIFALKNMGWTDKTEVDQTITDKTPPKIEYYTPDE